MRAFITTMSAAVLGFSSLAFVNGARADSFSISYSDGSFFYVDDDYYNGRIYRETPVYIVYKDWTPPRARYHRHHGRDHWRHAHRRHHRHHRHHGHHGHHGHHKGHHHKHHW